MYKRIYHGGIEHRLRQEVRIGTVYAMPPSPPHSCYLVWQCVCYEYVYMNGHVLLCVALLS